jgi:predicted PurR-regulated permease PerM
VLTPIFFAFLIAYMLDPVVDRLERWKVPRPIGITLLLALVLGAIGLFVILVVPGIVRDAAVFGKEIPHHARNLMAKIEPWPAAQGVEVPHSWNEALQQFGGDIQNVAGTAIAPAGRVVQWVVGGTANVLAAIGGLLVIPVFAFYLLNDFDRMTSSIRDLVPHRFRPFVVDVAREVDEVLGQFIRGQLIVMLFLAVLFAVSYSLLGVRLAVPIGILAGLLSFIPYVGGAFALGAALLMCALDFDGWGQVIGVVAAYAVIQLLEGFVITPRIMEGKIGLSAIWVLVALMIGGELFGFLGVLLAVPAAAVTKIFVVRAVAYYRKSELFTAGAPDETDKPMEMLLAEEGLPDAPAMAAAKAEAVAAVQEPLAAGDAVAAAATESMSLPDQPDQPKEPEET